VLGWKRSITLQPVESEPRWFRGYLLATTVLFFGVGIFGFIVTLGSDDSIAGRIISGAVSVGFLYFGVRRLRLLRVH
jgi:hypothetical protein